MRLRILLAAGTAAAQLAWGEASNPRGFLPTDEAIRRFEQRVAENPRDFISRTLLGQLRMRRARETGDFENYLHAEADFRAALKARDDYAPAKIQLAAVHLARHRFSDALALAREACAMDPLDLAALALIADASLALGDYDAAEKACAELGKASDQPAALARLAALAQIRGDNARAIALLLRAAADAAENGAHPAEAAWYRVQAGELYFRTGRFEEARAQYDAALELAPDHWSTTEHLAELRAAEGKFEEAIALYEKVIARTQRPELQQALGDLYVFMQKPREAKPWHDKALAAYRASADNGEAHYLHHLATLYCDTPERTVEALEWARKDFALRQDVHGCAGLARALYRAGKHAEALETIRRALAPGIQDAHLFQQAAMISMAAGEPAEARRFFEKSAAINPRLDAFHAHR